MGGAGCGGCGVRGVVGAEVGGAGYDGGNAVAGWGGEWLCEGRAACRPSDTVCVCARGCARACGCICACVRARAGGRACGRAGGRVHFAGGWAGGRVYLCVRACVRVHLCGRGRADAGGCVSRGALGTHTHGTRKGYGHETQLKTCR